VDALLSPCIHIRGFNLQHSEMFWLSLVFQCSDVKTVMLCECYYLSPGPNPGLIYWWNTILIYSMLVISVMNYFLSLMVINGYKLKK
jgi:hypothetical protein